MSRAWLSYLLCGVHTPGQRLPKEAVADPLPKYLMQCSPVQRYITKSSKEAVADPTWAQLTIATKYGMFWLLCSGRHGVHEYSQQ